MRLTLLLVVSLGLLLVPRESRDQATSGQAVPVSPAERAAQLRAKVDAAEKTAGAGDPSLAAALNELAVFYFKEEIFKNREHGACADYAADSL